MAGRRAPRPTPLAHPLARWWCVLLLCSGCSHQRVRAPRFPPLLPSLKSPVLFKESFDQLDPNRWHEVEVRGSTQYGVAELDGARCLKAESHNAASILVETIRFKPQTYQKLSWRWRVDQLVEGEALARKEGSDVAARVYVYFETKGLPWQKRSLDYIWSVSLPVGTVLDSAFSFASKMIVVESGAESLKQWKVEERDLVEDYKRCFGENPPDVIAIGLMSDTDNTGHDALAYFDDLGISRRTTNVTSSQGH